MRNRFFGRAASGALMLACLATVASAQTPPPPAAVEKPTYVAIPLEITVNRPVAEVWKRIGGYCPISWSTNPCTVLSGTGNEVGAVRSLGNGEIMVATTEYSYTYTQPVRVGRPFNAYHGTLEARALTPTTTKLLYTLFFDNSMLPDDAAREKDIANRKATFTGLLQNMKTVAEGGKLPPAPAAGATPAR